MLYAITDIETTGGRAEQGSITEIAILLHDGQKVVDSSVAETFLPTGSGFFFGSTEYDEWYIKDLEYTKKVLEKAIKTGDVGDYYYQASW